MKKDIRVFAPASVANVACGFDIFGFALEKPGDEVIVRSSQKKGVTLSKITGDKGALPLDPSKNTVGVGVLKLLEKLGTKEGVDIELIKHMPLGSGLGSSAASAAASVFAVNEFFDKPFSTKQLVQFAMEAEKVACGSAHADNVAPALMGGFILIRSYEPLDLISIPLKKDLYCAVLHPKMEISTEKARKILKKEISLKQHVIQSANAAGLIFAILEGDYYLMGRCLQDVIAEPLRSTLIPGFAQIKAAALEAGALGSSISGSGPSIFALSQTKVQAEKIGEAMKKACEANKLDCDLYVSSINKQGPRIL